MLNVDINCLAYRRQNYDAKLTSVRNYLFRYIKQTLCLSLHVGGWSTSQQIPFNSKDTLMMLKEMNKCEYLLGLYFYFYNTNTNLQTLQLGKQTKIHDYGILHRTWNFDQNNSWKRSPSLVKLRQLLSMLSGVPPMDQQKGLGGVNSDTDDGRKRACGCDHTCSLRRGCTRGLPYHDSSKNPYDNAA